MKTFKTSCFLLLLVIFSGTNALAYNGWLDGDGSCTNPYYISDVADWNYFASLLSDPVYAPYYCDKHYRLGNDIGVISGNIEVVTTWAATLKDYPFRGTFDGQGHTIYINLEKTSDGIVPGDETTQGVALFQYVGGGCVIHDLKIDGNIYSDYEMAGGFISYIVKGSSSHLNAVNVSRCTSHVHFVLGKVGDAMSGGLVAFSEEYVHLTVNDCLFSGSYYGANCTHLSGIVGFQASNGYTYIENCYVNPGGLTIPKDANNRNLCRYNNKDCFKDSNCYYSATASGFDDDQGDYVSSSHSADWVADKLGYWTVVNDHAIPMTLDMVAPHCTLFKGFTVSSFFILDNDNDNYGDQGVTKLVDGDRASTWCVSYPYYPHFIWQTIYVDFNNDKKFIPKGYILTTGNNSKEHPDRRPKKWQICGYQNTYTTDFDVLDTREASSSKEKLPEADMVDKVYLFPNYENINTEYQKFMFEVVELWREDRVWDGIFHGGWNINEADFVCELGEIQIFGVLSDEEVHRMENCAISGMLPYYDYTGETIPLQYRVTDYYNDQLVEYTHYTKNIVRKYGIQTWDNVTEIKEPGEYTITVNGINNGMIGYTGSKSYSFVVMDSSLPKPMAWTNNNGTAYYYVNMPFAYQTTLDLTETDPDFTSPFYVFSNNGYNQPYSPNCDGKLLIHAPEGYVLQVQGEVSCKGYPDEYLVMYNGSDTNSPVLGDDHYGIYGTKDIPLSYTTGQDLLLYFKSNGVQSDFTGVNLSVTPVSVTAGHDITIATDDHGALTTTDVTTDVTVNTPITLNVVPDEGYKLQEVSVKTSNGTEVMSDKGLWYTGKNTVTLNMPASDVDVTPTFATLNDLSINMPANSSDLAHATNAIIPADVTSFKIYDDGGPIGKYSKYCNGMLLLTAPENTVFEISGTLDIYDYDDSYFEIYNGDDFRDPIEWYYVDTNINKVLTTGNKMLLVFVTYEYQYEGLKLTVKVINKNDEFDIDIVDVTGGTVAVHGGATTAHVYDTLTLDVTTNNGYLITGYTMEPDCNRPVSGGIWHENPTEATFVMPAENIEITPTITNTLTADGGLYINMPTSNKYFDKVVEIPSGVTSFKVYDDGGKDGDYSMYCDGYLVLKAPWGYRLKLSGTVRCNNSGAIHDYLKIYDGDTITAAPLGKPNGYGNTNGEIIDSLVSSHNSMELNFYSANNSMSGLNLTVEVTNEAYPYIITFDDSQAPEGCSIAISGYHSHSELVPNEYVANIGNTITVTVNCDDNHWFNFISLTDGDGNEIPLSNGMCWYNGNYNTATFTMLPRNLFITYEFVNKGDQYIKLPKQNGIETEFEVIPIDGITSFKIYDDGGQNANYSNNCDSYTLLTAPEGMAWQLTGTVKTENGNDYMIPYDGEFMTTMIDGCRYGKPSGEDIGTLVTINNQMLIVFNSNSAVNMEGLDLTATIINPIKRVVVGYANPQPGHDGWTFIAAPFKNGKAPTYVENLFPVGEVGEPLVTSTEYDLYRYNQSATAEWENYKMHSGNFSIDGGSGYLYATKYARTMQFGGSVWAEESKKVPLAYDDNAGMPGWNLVGNPLMTEAYADRPYYQMCELGNDIELVDYYWRFPIPVCTGVIVCADGANDTVTFSKAQPQQPGEQGSVKMTLTKAGTRGAEYQDMAIVSFNEGSKLGKFVFNEENSKLYIPQDGRDYAIAYAKREGEVPLSFKAKTTGRYTISFEGDDLNGVQLIDKFEDITVNLNDVRSYTFVGSVADSPDRFTLVFNSEATIGNSFVYQNGSDIIVNGNGELQVFDVLGRMVATMHINGVETMSTSSLQSGVYVFRLNGKTQKVIVTLF